MTEKEDLILESILNTRAETSVPVDADLPAVDIPADVVAVLDEPIDISPILVKEPTKEDFDYVRKNLHNIIDQGKIALTQLLEIAKQSQHPRAFEVVSLLIKSVTESNNQLINIHKQIQEIDRPNMVNNDKIVEQHNNVFVGSTSELFSLLKKERERKE